MDRHAFDSQIQRILTSHTFASKTQLRRLLEILAAHFDSQNTLQPHRVIQELWPEQKDRTSRDLATAVNRLRAALEAYYTDEGVHDSLLIRLPKRVGEVPGEFHERTWIAAELRPSAPPCAPPPDPIAAPAAEEPSPNGHSPQNSIPAQPAYRIKTLAAILVTAAVMCAVAAFAFFRMRSPDGPPVTARIDGNTLVVVNAKGEQLWTRGFPDGFWADFYRNGLAPDMWFGDLDGSGKTTILLLYHPTVDGEARSTTLICFSDRGDELWRWTPGRVLPELGGEPAVFRTTGLAVLKAKPGAAAQILMVSDHYPQYPTQVALIDTRGKTVSEYWHSGHLDHMVLADLDGDGRQQILLLGTSNGYNQATLVVLDPARMGGASLETARPELQIHGMGIAQERFRLLFPRSDLSRATTRYGQAREITFANGVIRVTIEECRISPYCLAWYQFDSRMNLRNAYPDDQFRDTHDQFYRTSDRHTFTEAEAQEFWKVRCLVGCRTDFVEIAKPTANPTGSGQ